MRLYVLLLCVNVCSAWISSFLSRFPTMQWLRHSCTINPLELQGLQSLDVTLGRADVAADLSWIEGVLATKERGRGLHAEDGSPKSQPQGRNAERSRNVDSCESPFDEITTGSAVTMEERLVPQCAKLSVGAFALVCRDDRVKKNNNGDHHAAVQGLRPVASLGKLEIVSEARNGVTTTWDSDDTKPSCVAATAATTGVKHSSLAVSWNTLTATAGEKSSGATGLGLAKPGLSSMLKKFFSRNSAKQAAPTGPRASLLLGEVRIQCRPLEAGAKRGVEKSPTHSSCVVVRNISVVPSVVEVQPGQPGQQNPSIELAESRRAQQPPPSLPPQPSPPQPLPLTRLQRFQVPKVKIHASTITGTVDAGLAGWLNLRGLRESEFMAAKGRRMAKLAAAGKQENTIILRLLTLEQPIAYLSSRFLVAVAVCVIVE